MAGSTIYEGNGKTAKILNPRKIKPNECLDLALCGKDAWNEWQEEFSDEKNLADFSNVNFQNYPFIFQNFIFKCKVKFVGATFGLDSANFNKARFHQEANFSNARFTGMAEFNETIFDKDVNFDGSEFSSATNFNDSIFNGNGNFSKVIFFTSGIFWRAKFSGAAFFRETCFEENAVFRGASFHKGAYFEKAIFKKMAFFPASQFFEAANFSHTEFGGNAFYNGSQFSLRTLNELDSIKENIDFSGAKFHGSADFSASDWKALTRYYQSNFETRKKQAIEEGLDPGSISAASFRGANFSKSVIFNGRVFTGPVDFGPLDESSDRDVSHKNSKATVFKSAPHFYECKIHQNSSFYKAQFPPPSGDHQAAGAYCALKLAFSQKQDLRMEQLFFKLEMQEEALLNKRQYWLYRLYTVTSDYGFSTSRPLLLLILTPWILASISYAFMADLSPCVPGSNGCDMLGVLFQFSLISIPGFEKIAWEAKDALFSGNMGISVYLVILIQKILTLMGLFLTGLSLRNLFKMK
ncbi:pentapeptide repeat-containing protein [Cellvibrio sp. ARAG 10.3]|uniref:pentapeptide repeat-containing protein n=1 Tax=Cellvibrio sp. ARAG 10.3 TaxID=3451358 RepID=UPI003F478005